MTDVLYRIIDANFNRSREALRVMEEFCRFGLNSATLSGQAKQYRHLLCASMQEIDPQKRLINRDVSGDVGRELRVEGQLKRQSLQDCFTAAAKRAGEALRTLAESTQTINPSVAATMEKIRFSVYSLENTDDTQTLDLIKVCIENGADCLQLRAKNHCDSSLLDLSLKFTDLCAEADVVSIINDRADIAILSNADGVHLGQTEIPVSCAKKLAQYPLIVGLSTHNLDELRHAVDSGCDYVAIGPAFASPTKPHLNVAGPDYIKQAIPVLNQSGVCHVAIGGINPHNISSLLDLGVRAVAISSAISHSENPADSCKTLKDTLLSS
jgi:thiamine-phosphate pyrophosphorylase